LTGTEGKEMMKWSQGLLVSCMLSSFFACKNKSSSELDSTKSYPFCSEKAIDPDGDGWGWENEKSCRVPPACRSAASDPDGDGWGWENQRSCKVMVRAAAAGPDVYLEMERTALKSFPIGPIPSPADISALVSNGFPKPENDKERALRAHNTLMKWGQDAIAQAFLLKELSASQQLNAARDLRNRLLRFVNFGENFGSRLDETNYGNLSLELIWFMGNLVRSAQILSDMSSTLGNQSGWTPQDRDTFASWASRMADQYFELGIYPAGLSNRKASQLEVLMRIAVLKGDQDTLRAHGNALETLILNAVDARGIVPEDSPRDKYHPQFFLAAVLQALEMGKQRGLPRLGPAAAQKLVTAIQYSAVTNTNAAAPAEFPKVQSTPPNFEIPFWYLVPIFHNDYGKQLSPQALRMVQENYKNASRFDFTMNWGFNAYAVKHRL
jgi:hypothetical protein